ncbi:glycerate kinase [Collibacillus ludicampi]|uniref:Glycerate kinase n=1 Tax=Collibacillus ludicampi TaxID=2771369 RepID=A0AAV4LCI6_9BACL|nr:glycerate kinase [Collibacillus ludicampi]GIM45516.1 glycerate kinase [Collibacillus ludicampi]
MKILVASDSYKGSLSTFEVIEAVKEAVKRVGINIEVLGIPIADGGEGTVEVVLQALKGKKIHCKATDPLGRPITAYFGLIEHTAIVEMAVASGLTKLSHIERNPLDTTTYGTGEVIRAALDHPEVKKLIIAIGGSATNDGGVGLAQALGLRALDEKGNEIQLGGRHIDKIAKLDTCNMHPRLKKVQIQVICDVINPLCGPNGASAVYGPQKGATPEMVEQLDKNLLHLARILEKDLGKDVLNLPGAGAAGGTGAGLVAFCGATLEPGIEVILDLFQIDEHLKDVELVITGEGRTDFQTEFGKAVIGIAKRAKRFGKTVVCVSGALGEGYQELYQHGIDAFFSICPRPINEQESMVRAYSYLVDTLENIIRLYAKNWFITTKCG